MNTIQNTPALSAGLLVTLRLPRVDGRVLALRTMQRQHASEYLLSDADEQKVYLTTASDNGTLGAAHDVQPVGELGEWLSRPESTSAVAKILNAQDKLAAPLGTLTFARAVNHMIEQPAGSADDAIERAVAIGRQCAKSEADTAAAVASVMRGGPATLATA